MYLLALFGLLDLIKNNSTQTIEEEKIIAPPWRVIIPGQVILI